MVLDRCQASSMEIRLHIAILMVRDVWQTVSKPKERGRRGGETLPHPTPSGRIRPTRAQKPCGAHSNCDKTWVSRRSARAEFMLGRSCHLRQGSGRKQNPIMFPLARVCMFRLVSFLPLFHRCIAQLPTVLCSRRDTLIPVRYAAKPRVCSSHTQIPERVGPGTAEASFVDPCADLSVTRLAGNGSQEILNCELKTSFRRECKLPRLPYLNPCSFIVPSTVVCPLPPPKDMC